MRNYKEELREISEAYVEVRNESQSRISEHKADLAKRTPKTNQEYCDCLSRLCGGGNQGDFAKTEAELIAEGWRPIPDSTAQMKIFYHPYLKGYLGDVYGTRFAGSEQELYRHLVRKLNFRPTDAAAVIERLRNHDHSGGSVGGKSLASLKKAFQNLHLAKAAHAGGNFQHREHYLSHAARHLDAAREHLHDEYKGANPPALAHHLKHIDDMHELLKRFP
jgi:hypothetical protein